MKKYGLIGKKLAHSYSQIIHERYFSLTGRENFSYDLIEIPANQLSLRLKEIALEYDGINVTIPYKTDVLEHLTDLSPEAEKIGSVNTIVFTKDGSFGYNTDYFGLKSTFDDNSICISGKRVVILGTGGVSKTALAVCKDMGASDITFVTSSSKSVEGYRTISYNDNIQGDVLINCTPVGMYPDLDSSPMEILPESFTDVVDMIYNPSVTRLMATAQSMGIKAVNGLSMLVYQGIYSEAIWNGEDIDKRTASAIIEEFKKVF